MLQHGECPTAALCWGWALPGALKQPRSFQEITRLEQQGLGEEWTVCHLLLGPKHSFRAPTTSSGQDWTWSEKDQHGSAGLKASNSKPQGLWHWNQPFSFKQG